MRDALLLSLAAGVAAAVATRPAWDYVVPAGGNAVADLGSTLQAVLSVVPVVRIAAMSDVDRTLLLNTNVAALLMVIRTGEGTADLAGYRRLYGGGTFVSFADHPRVFVKAGGITSSAAGAYQFLASTWDETADAMALGDFSPLNQDYGALGRLAARGALGPILQGDLTTALARAGKEWASMPGSPYGQPTIGPDRAASVYLANGGTLA
jgi:muramidase (phage lysozyme)